MRTSDNTLAADTEITGHFSSTRQMPTRQVHQLMSSGQISTPKIAPATCLCLNLHPYISTWQMSEAHFEVEL